MSQIAKHDGTVMSVSQGRVEVEMHVLSACASCEAHDKCAFVDKADKIVEVQTGDWKSYSPGDSVVVTVDEGLGLFAVLLAYVLPAVIIVGAVVLLVYLTGSELLAILVPLALVAVYFLLLYRFRDRLQRQFSFGIVKK